MIRQQQRPQVGGLLVHLVQGVPSRDPVAELLCPASARRAASSARSISPAP